jgi:hypothetical protein
MFNVVARKLILLSLKVSYYLPVLYGCETWSIAQRQEHRLKIVVNKVLSRISGPKREEVTGGWRK